MEKAKKLKNAKKTTGTAAKNTNTTVNVNKQRKVGENVLAARGLRELKKKLKPYEDHLERLEQMLKNKNMTERERKAKNLKERGINVNNFTSLGFNLICFNPPNLKIVSCVAPNGQIHLQYKFLPVIKIRPIVPIINKYQEILFIAGQLPLNNE